MKNQNCITHPQLQSQRVISLAVDLQNTIFYDTFGNTIGWINHHNRKKIWLESEKDLFEEIDWTKMWSEPEGHYSVEFVDKVTWGLTTKFVEIKKNEFVN